MLSERLKLLRTERNMSQADVALLLNISRQAYNHYESGKREPDTDMLIKLANIFDVSMDYLLGRSDDHNYADTSINSDWPPEAKVLFRDAHKLTPEQRDIVMKLIKEFIGESK